MTRSPAGEIDQAVGEYRAALKRTRFGRVIATADLVAGVVVMRTIEVSQLTRMDLERIMREPPGPLRKEGTR